MLMFIWPFPGHPAHFPLLGASFNDIHKIFGFFAPSPIVRIWNWFILQNSHNLPYYFRLSMTSSSSDVDIISGCSLSPPPPLYSMPISPSSSLEHCQTRCNPTLPSLPSHPSSPLWDDSLSKRGWLVGWFLGRRIMARGCCAAGGFPRRVRIWKPPMEFEFKGRRLTKELAVFNNFWGIPPSTPLNSMQRHCVSPFLCMHAGFVCYFGSSE